MWRSSSFSLCLRLQRCGSGFVAAWTLGKLVSEGRARRHFFSGSWRVPDLPCYNSVAVPVSLEECHLYIRWWLQEERWSFGVCLQVPLPSLHWCVTEWHLQDLTAVVSGPLRKRNFIKHTRDEDSTAGFGRFPGESHGKNSGVDTVVAYLKKQGRKHLWLCVCWIRSLHAQSCTWLTSLQDTSQEVEHFCWPAKPSGSGLSQKWSLLPCVLSVYWEFNHPEFIKTCLWQGQTQNSQFVSRSWPHCLKEDAFQQPWNKLRLLSPDIFCHHLKQISLWCWWLQCGHKKIGIQTFWLFCWKNLLLRNLPVQPHIKKLHRGLGLLCHHVWKPPRNLSSTLVFVRRLWKSSQLISGNIHVFIRGWGPTSLHWCHGRNIAWWKASVQQIAQFFLNVRIE